MAASNLPATASRGSEAAFLVRPTPNAECLEIAAEGAAPSRVRRASVPEGRESPNSLLGALLGALDLGTTSAPESRKGVSEPSEPKSITMVAKSPSMTRLLWEPPTCIHGLVDVYEVKVCEMFSECDQKQNLSDCIEHEVTDTWLDFDSKEDTPYCVLITASTRCGGKVLTSPPAMQEVRTPLSSLPDVSNLRLISAKSGHITLSWQRPKGRFDYYSVEVTEDKLSSPDTAKHWLGLCANGTIIRPDQTELTCGPLEPCSNLSCTMRTHLSGPPERSSPGVTLKGIFIPAEDPNPPTNLTMFPESSSRTRLQWEQPEKVSGIMESYNLKICSKFESCDRAEGLSNCAEYLTTETWAAFDSSVDTSYCVLVTVKTRCSFDDVSSRPLIAEIRTPLFDLPDATNLRLLSAAENCITVGWERPQARFDYFWLSIADNEDEGHGNAQTGRVGSCGNGTIIHPNQTWATCPNLEACTKVSITLRTHRNGPPERTSHGVRLQGIFILGEVLPDVTNLNLKAVDNHYVTVAWDQPRGTFDFYWLDVTNENDNEKDSLEKHNVGSCGNGTIIRAEETQVTCGPFEPCSNISVTVGTSIKGPPARSSMGTTLKGVLLSGQDPSEPKNINFVAKSPSMARLQWEPPTRIHGILDIYKVKVCKEYTVCDRKESPGGCIENSSSDDCLDFETTADTSYCVVITASARCGVDVLTSLPATLETQKTKAGLTKFTYRNLDLTMEDETLAPYVQHHPSDASVPFVHGEEAPLKTPPKRAWKSRCTAMGLLKVSVGVLLITTVASLLSFFLHRGEPTPIAEYLIITDAPAEGAALSRVQHETVPEARPPPKTVRRARRRSVELGTISVPETRKGGSALPDVTNFTLLAADNHYITLAWDKPRRSIDFYLLDVTGGSGYENDSLWKQRAGTCSNGTFIYAEQTQVTCGPFDACSNLSATIRTYTTGPPRERASKGTTLKDIFLSGHEPSEPKSITMVAKSPSMTRLLWEPPSCVHGLVDVYKVKVCETFSECEQKQNLSDCIEREVSDTWLDFDSKEDTPYCVLITASARCGGKVLTSLPAMQEVRTPLFSLPDVSNLRLISAKSGHITLSWQRPKGRFDYYSVEVTEDKVSSTDTAKHWLGLCANGTIIRPDQTVLTCGPLEPCRNLSCTMRTHLSGPPERSSPGVTLTGIFIPAEDPDPPRNITSGQKISITYPSTMGTIGKSRRKIACIHG
ncbi:hypothetical protein HPB49_012490 [Dermacentor silvarum]|uniref:Uncharacterized protein n=1 Tax=Dermacentor silvarum TaxID=543639 RepID=A0ACB8C3K4_DERSI|nr:hypothetical protein HPB49_012490 [Dermacentor silvarum]